MKTHDNDCTSLLDLCRRGNTYSIMEEDQACAMDRDPGELHKQLIVRYISPEIFNNSYLVKSSRQTVQT